MKLLLTGITLIFYSSFTWANAKVVGNGRHPLGIEVQFVIRKVVEETLSQKSIYPELQKIDFEIILQKLKVLISQDTLSVTINGHQQESMAINFPETATIIVNESYWKRSVNNVRVREAMILHEILGLVGLERTGDYSVSERYLSFGAGNYCRSRVDQFTFQSRAKQVATEHCGTSALDSLYLTDYGVNSEVHGSISHLASWDCNRKRYMAIFTSRPIDNCQSIGYEFNYALNIK